MIDIFINGSKVGLDKTATISLNLINFDIKDISNRSLNYTNDFKIPVAGNELIFEFSSGINKTGTLPYTDFAVRIIADGIELMENGRGWITSVADNYYNITVTEKSSAIQEMKEYGLNSAKTKTYTVSTDSLTKQLINGTGSNYKLDFLYNEYQYSYGQTNPDNFDADSAKGFLSRYVKDIFSEFATASGFTFSGSLYTDIYFSDLRVVLYSHTFQASALGGTAYRVYQAVVNPSNSFFDLFKEVLKIFCAVFKVEGTVITIEKFDDLTWTSPVDWSNKLVKINSKDFQIEGTSQVNYLRYEPQESAKKTLNEMSLACNNNNLNYEADLIKMNASVYPFVNIDSLHTSLSAQENAIYLTEKDAYVNGASFFTLSVPTNKSIDNFIFLVDGTDSFGAGLTVNLPSHGGSSYPWTAINESYTTLSGDNTTIANFYNSVNDYIRILAMLQDTVVYEVDLLLSPIDIHNFDPFNIVSIPELGGKFYVNSIKNYLLSSDNKTATVELIKIS